MGTTVYNQGQRRGSVLWQNKTSPGVRSSRARPWGIEGPGWAFAALEKSAPFPQQRQPQASAYGGQSTSWISGPPYLAGLTPLCDAQTVHPYTACRQDTKALSAKLPPLLLEKDTEDCLPTSSRIVMRSSAWKYFENNFNNYRKNILRTILLSTSEGNVLSFSMWKQPLFLGSVSSSETQIPCPFWRGRSNTPGTWWATCSKPWL